MNATKNLVYAGLAMALSFTVSACNNDANSGDGGSSCPPKLYYVTPQTQAVLPNGTATLSVHVEDCNAVTLPGTVVSYQLSGDTKGAKLSADSASTDAQGNVSITTTAGAVETTYQVQVSAPYSNSLTFNVTVSLTAPGQIVVNMSYAGTKTFNQFQATLYQNKACADLIPTALPTALQSAAPVSSISGHPSFSNVSPGAGYAVVVLARESSKTLGYGCVDALNVNPGQLTTATITIRDLPILFSGVYKLDSLMDFAGELPPSVAIIVRIFDEITNDHDPACGGTGSPQCTGTGMNRINCGCDPAAFIIDFIYRVLCDWRCGTGETYSSCLPWSTYDLATDHGHFYGDLADIYINGNATPTVSMASWPKAKSAYTVNVPILGSVGTCSIVDIFGPRSPLSLIWNPQQALQGVITQYSPSLALAILQIAGDLARVITDMNIKSDLALTGVSADHPGQFQHSLKQMVAIIHDLHGVATPFTVDLVAAGFTNLTKTGTASVDNGLLIIPAHSYELSFGKLIFYVYTQGILPLFISAPYNTTHLLQTLVDCVAFANWLISQGSVAQTICSLINCANTCTSALALAGGAIDNLIQNNITSATATITLNGYCSPGQVDEDTQLAQTLVNGIWQGVWVEGTSSGAFTGVFNGIRSSDPIP